MNRTADDGRRAGSIIGAALFVLIVPLVLARFGGFRLPVIGWMELLILGGVVAGTVLLLLKSTAGGRSATPADAPMQDEELEIMRDIQRGLDRMEQRIDSLETLLDDRKPDKDSAQ